MATSPKNTSEVSAGAKAPAFKDPQKVNFKLDPDLKKQLDAGGSYKPSPEKLAKEYIPPGPGIIGDGSGVGGSSGIPSTEPESTPTT